jgi:hypothetical protein
MKWFEIHGISTSLVNKHNLKRWTKNLLNTIDGGFSNSEGTIFHCIQQMALVPFIMIAPLTNGHVHFA